LFPLITAQQLKVDPGSESKIVHVRPKHIVMATGNGRKNIPKWPGMEKFAGKIYHSDDHKDFERWAGKRAVVVGAVGIIHPDRF
jgi:cation diffusion facilitator CzcD-associated flavoprotein CzcO